MDDKLISFRQSFCHKLVYQGILCHIEKMYDFMQGTMSGGERCNCNWWLSWRVCRLNTQNKTKKIVATSYLFDVFRRNSEATYHKLQFVQRGVVVTAPAWFSENRSATPGACSLLATAGNELRLENSHYNMMNAIYNDYRRHDAHRTLFWEIRKNRDVLAL
jgi:hypothetical protein